MVAQELEHPLEISVVCRVKDGNPNTVLSSITVKNVLKLVIIRQIQIVLNSELNIKERQSFRLAVCYFSYSFFPNAALINP